MDTKDFTRYVEAQFARGAAAVPVDEVIHHFTEEKGYRAEDVEDALAVGLVLRKFSFRDDDRALVPHVDTDIDRMAARMRDVMEAAEFMDAVTKVQERNRRR